MAPSIHRKNNDPDSGCTFPWHRWTGAVQASKLHSSQALAIDVFGTIAVSDHRDAVLNRIATELGLPGGRDWRVELEWKAPGNALNERRQTQIDAAAISREAAILFECKFTEGGGTCSQVQTRRGQRQCNGRYEMQRSPLTGVEGRCALAGKNIRYWDFIPQVMTIDPERDHAPCPFAGAAFQWMRNLVTARAFGQRKGIPTAAVVAYPAIPGVPMVEKMAEAAWQDFIKAVRRDQVVCEALSYQRIIELARGVSDDPLWSKLEAWVADKFARWSKMR